VAHHLAGAGARVVVTGRRTNDGERVAAAIVAAGGTAQFMQADLTVADDVDALFATTLSAYGPVTVLVNNAAPTDLVGPSNKDGRLTDVDPEQFDEILAVGLRAAYLCCYHAIPQMQDAGHGSIVNVSSVAGVKATPRVFAYATAKGGLQALTRSVAADYARDAIRCNTVIVGFVISNPLARKFADDEKMSRAMRATMLTDFGEPEDIATVVRFLASSDSRFMSGTDVYADGGATVKHVIPGTKQEARAE
jgi:NAD(P)-dependent dehydrogenase (short-subunit alcohol dehydrogenase family)